MDNLFRKLLAEIAFLAPKCQLFTEKRREVTVPECDRIWAGGSTRARGFRYPLSNDRKVRIVKLYVD